MLDEEIKKIQARHSIRPLKLRKGKSWMCKCSTINLYEQTICKMIKVQTDKVTERFKQAVIKNQLEAQGIKPEKPKRERFKHNKAERSERARLLELFTGSLRGE